MGELRLPLPHDIVSLSDAGFPELQRGTGDPRHRVAAADIVFCCSSSFRDLIGTKNWNGPEDGREEILPPSSSPLREAGASTPLSGALRPLLPLLQWINHHREFAAGCLMAALGLFIAFKGTTYRAGTLMHMGPGFLPTALGVILVLLGIAIALPDLKKSSAPVAEPTPAPLPGEHAESQTILPDHPQWFAWACILASPVAFIVFGRYFGMAPGTFACVLVAAMGDKDAKWRSSIILATIVTVFGVGLFSYFLQVPMPIFTFRGGL
jgi:hypothetical protein